MSKILEFIFDFASPNAYFVHKAIPDLIARTSARVQYVPCLLGGIFKATNNKAPFIQFADVPAKLAYEQLEMTRFVTATGNTKYQMNSHFPINTLLIMRGAVAAANDGLLAQYAEAVFNDMWENGRNMADPTVVIQSLEKAGFDSAQLLAQAQDQAVKDELVSNTERAVARGAFGVPTFFVDDQMFFGKERLAQVEVALLAKN
jgi:2-hydroxychromene-2-carboxylate isomerase